MSMSYNRVFTDLTGDEPVESIIQHTPSTEIYERGKDLIREPVDAMAELIDNSIDAFATKIEIVEVHSPDSSYLLVMDNGRGISKAKFADFATYASSKAGRSKRDQSQMSDSPPSSSKKQKANDGSAVSNCYWFENDNSSSQSDSLGVYGVGAKDAGSYLGDQMSVFSKTTTDGINLLKFNDRDNHESTTRFFPSVYALVEYFQNPNDIFNISCSKHVIPTISEHFTSFSTGTIIIIIKLRKKVIDLLANRGIEGKIASYYHFYLHPEDKKLVGSPRMRGSSEISIHYVKIRGKQGIEGIHEEKVNCKTIVKHEVRQLFEHYQVSQLKFHAVIQKSTTTEGFIVHGAILYIPKEDGHSRYIEQQQRITQSNCLGSKVFWRGRLLPGCSINTLKIFPPKDPFTLIQGGPSYTWKDRIYIIAFYESNNVSYNKYDAIEDLNYYLTYRDTIYHNGSQNEFRNWIVNCYQKYDKEFAFSRQGPVISSQHQQQNDKTYFQKLILLPNEDNSFERGDTIVFTLTNTPTVKIYGTVLGFVVNESLRTDYYVGSGSLIYQQLPHDIYGSKCQLEVYLSDLIRESIKKFDPVKDPGLSQKRQLAPIDIEICLTNSDLKLFKTLTKQLSAEIPLYQLYSEFQVKIKDEKQRPVICVPEYKDPKSKKLLNYTIDIKYTRDGKVTNYPITKIPEWFNEKEQKIETYDGTKESHRSSSSKVYYPVRGDRAPIQLTEIGKGTITVTIYAPDALTPQYPQLTNLSKNVEALEAKRLKTFIFPIEVVLPQIEAIEILNLMELKAAVTRYGSFLPDIRLKLLNATGETVRSTDQLQLGIQSISVQIKKVGSRQSSSVIAEISQKGSEPEYIIHGESYFLESLEPKKSNMNSNTVSFTLFYNKPQQQSSVGKGIKANFQLTVLPGLPYSLKLIHPKLLSELKEDEVIEKMELQIVDKFGNPTTSHDPIDIVFSSDGVLKQPETNQIKIHEETGIITITNVEVDLDYIYRYLSRDRASVSPVVLPQRGFEGRQTIVLARRVQEQFRPLELGPIRIMPLHVISKLVICRHGIKLLSDDPIECKAGESLDGLSFQLVNQEQKPIREYLERFQEDFEKSKLEYNYEGKGGTLSLRLGTNFTIPTLLLPTKEGVHMISFKFYWGKNDPPLKFSTTIRVKVIPSSPHQFHLSNCVFLKTRGIRLYESTDLKDRIGRIRVLDEYNNRISLSLNATSFSPVLQVFKSKGEEIEEESAITEEFDTDDLLGEIALSLLPETFEYHINSIEDIENARLKPVAPGSRIVLRIQAVYSGGSNNSAASSSSSQPQLLSSKLFDSMELGLFPTVITLKSNSLKLQAYQNHHRIPIKLSETPYFSDIIFDLVIDSLRPDGILYLDDIKEFQVRIKDLSSNHLILQDKKIPVNIRKTKDIEVSLNGRETIAFDSYLKPDYLRFKDTLLSQIPIKFEVTVTCVCFPFPNTQDKRSFKLNPGFIECLMLPLEASRCQLTGLRAELFIQQSGIILEALDCSLYGLILPTSHPKLLPKLLLTSITSNSRKYPLNLAGFRLDPIELYTIKLSEDGFSAILIPKNFETMVPELVPSFPLTFKVTYQEKDEIIRSYYPSSQCDRLYEVNFFIQSREEVKVAKIASDAAVRPSNPIAATPATTTPSTKSTSSSSQSRSQPSPLAAIELPRNTRGMSPLILTNRSHFHALEESDELESIGCTPEDHSFFGKSKSVDQTTSLAALHPVPVPPPVFSPTPSVSSVKQDANTPVLDVSSSDNDSDNDGDMDKDNHNDTDSVAGEIVIAESIGLIQKAIEDLEQEQSSTVPFLQIKVLIEKLKRLLQQLQNSRTQPEIESVKKMLQQIQKLIHSARNVNESISQVSLEMMK